MDHHAAIEKPVDEVDESDVALAPRALADRFPTLVGRVAAPAQEVSGRLK